MDNMATVILVLLKSFALLICVFRTLAIVLISVVFPVTPTGCNGVLYLILVL